jgi:hypothetical protein
MTAFSFGFSMKILRDIEVRLNLHYYNHNFKEGVISVNTANCVYRGKWPCNLLPRVSLWAWNNPGHCSTGERVETTPAVEAEFGAVFRADTGYYPCTIPMDVLLMKP